MRSFLRFNFKTVYATVATGKLTDGPNLSPIHQGQPFLLGSWHSTRLIWKWKTIPLSAISSEKCLCKFNYTVWINKPCNYFPWCVHFSAAALKSRNISKQNNTYKALAHKAYFIIMPFSSIPEQVSKPTWEFLLVSSTLTHSLRSVICSNLLKYDCTDMLMGADIPPPWGTVEIKGDLFVRVLSKLVSHVQFWSSLPENMNYS